MARLIYSGRAFADLDRLVDFLLATDAPGAAATIELIAGAVSMLAEHPLIGRPVEGELRELVISRGHSGYVAIYSFERAHDVVLVLAVRHQREAGFVDDAGA